MAKIEIETAKNCATPPKHRPPRPPLDVVDVEIDPTRYKGDVLIRIEGNGEIFCETDRFSIGKGQVNNFVSKKDRNMYTTCI